MEFTISKELLCEILDKPIEEDVKISKELILYKKLGDKNGFVNIESVYRFSYLCKEWACAKGFILMSYTKPYEAVSKKGYCQLHHTQDKNRENDKPFNCYFEYEAIISSCEWILKQIKEKEND